MKNYWQWNTPGRKKKEKRKESKEGKGKGNQHLCIIISWTNKGENIVT